jgi:hypothetical protein
MLGNETYNPMHIDTHLSTDLRFRIGYVTSPASDNKGVGDQDATTAIKQILFQGFSVYKRLESSCQGIEDPRH